MAPRPGDEHLDCVTGRDQEKERWVRHKAACDKHLLQMCERQRRLDEGRPLMEVMKNKKPSSGSH